MNRDSQTPQRYSLFSELRHFFWKYKMWWLVPVMLVVVTLGLLVALGGSQMGFLIYALF